MRVVPPQPDITIYETGFDGIDLLGRNHTGKHLSDLVDRIEDPLVIAVDGSWGSGKSFFLKCWVGAHAKENGGVAKTVYFDAFKNDFLDDPLLSLTGAIAARFPENKPKENPAIKAAKNAVAKMWRPTARVGLAVASAGATEAASVFVDAGVKAAQKELERQIDQVWTLEQVQREAMGAFRAALEELTSAKEGEAGTKLVIAIDELDRCKPDYALSILETIKHFFDVKNVHFVLGVNLAELANSVRARYGNSVDAPLYLQKFITATIRLPSVNSAHPKNPLLSIEYFRSISLKMGINEKLSDEIESIYLNRATVQSSFSLRHAEKLATEITLTPNINTNDGRFVYGDRLLIYGLIVLKTLFPASYSKILDGQIELAEIRALFDLSDRFGDEDDNTGDEINYAWTTSLIEEFSDESRDWTGFFGTHNPRKGYWRVTKILREYVEAINFGPDVD